jgi:hypothetical protein
MILAFLSAAGLILFIFGAVMAVVLWMAGA